MLGRHPRVEQQIGWLFISIVIYEIWLEKNRRIHSRGKDIATVQLLSKMKIKMREKLFTCNSFKNHVKNDHSVVRLLY